MALPLRVLIMPLTLSPLHALPPLPPQHMHTHARRPWGAGDKGPRLTQACSSGPTWPQVGTSLSAPAPPLASPPKSQPQPTPQTEPLHHPSLPEAPLGQVRPFASHCLCWFARTEWLPQKFVASQFWRPEI